MPDQTQSPAASTSIWDNPTLQAAGIGAIAGTVLCPIFPLGTLAGGAIGAGVSQLYHGLFDDHAAPPAAAPAAPSAKPSAAPSAAPADPYKEGGKRLAASYSKDAVPSPLAPEDYEKSFGSLKSPEDRKKALEHLTQRMDPNNPMADVMCGPTALLGAAMMAGGNEGVAKLVQQMKNDRKDLDAKADTKGLDSILKDLKGGKLSNGDVMSIQTNLYKLLKDREAADKNNKPSSEPGVKTKTMSAFINEDGGALHDMLKENHMSVDLETLQHPDGKKNGHYVLNMGKNGIFDPEAVKDGNHVVTDPGRVHDYELARRLAITENTKLTQDTGY